MECFIVDSFTNEPYKGNPAGVCILTDDLPEQQMQAIARELNFSETAFVKHLTGHKYSIRYFSPKIEIPLCGHATLASAKILFSKSETTTELSFETIRGIELPIDKNDSLIQMKFPLYELIDASPPSKELLQAIGITKFKYVGYNKETDILFIEIEDHLALEKLTPQFSILAALPFKHMGVSISAKSSNSKFDFYSRFFWPWSGTNEDPVTGGTHTFLAKYWSNKLGKKKMNSFQCSPRTGFMEVELIDEKHFYIRGDTVIVFSGKLNL